MRCNVLDDDVMHSFLSTMPQHGMPFWKWQKGMVLNLVWRQTLCGDTEMARCLQ